MTRFRLVALSVVLTTAFWLALAVILYYYQFSKPDRANGADNFPLPQISGLPFVSDDEGEASIADSRLLIPLAGARADDLVDAQSASLKDDGAAHQGIDIPAKAGALVIAAAPGIIEKLSNENDLGKSVYVRSPDRMRLYYYSRLSNYAHDLSEGQVIGVGDQLGAVGSFANTDRKMTHLHFEVWAIMPDQIWSGNKRPINPYKLLGGR